MQGWMDAWMDGWMDGLMDAWMDEKWMDGGHAGSLGSCQRFGEAQGEFVVRIIKPNGPHESRRCLTCGVFRVW